jgi:hypothetical protein
MPSDQSSHGTDYGERPAVCNFCGYRVLERDNFVSVGNYDVAHERCVNSATERSEGGDS